ncbi:hypothetical protein DICVIV_14284, partial [Dictyocaulus viviparus]
MFFRYANINVTRGIFSTLKCCTKPCHPEVTNPTMLALHELYRQETATTCEKGYSLLRNGRLNKGLTFTLEERQYLGIHGLLPPTFMTEEQQGYRIMTYLRKLPDNLFKGITKEVSPIRY